MNRRKSIRALIVGTASAAMLAEACRQPSAQKPEAAPAGMGPDRMEEEKKQLEKLQQETFFTPGELAVITLLADIIIPRDAVSGSASDAGVPAFIEFIVKDMPQHQVPMRGGLRWIEMESLRRFGQGFAGITPEQRLAIVEDIAYPDRAKPAHRPGVAFFNRMRNLTASGFYTSPIGVKDIGYAGNVANQWNGVPDEVLRQYGLAYTEKDLEIGVKG
jgi:hypothetical protein